MDSKSILPDFYGFLVDFNRFLWIIGQFYLVFMDSRSILVGFYGFLVDFTTFLWILSRFRSKST